MKLLLDDDLVEAAVFLCATSRRDIAPASIRAFHRAREAAYATLDPDARQEWFAQVHLTYFREWGIERRLTTALEPFPLLAAAVAAFALRLSRSHRDESADLYVHPGGARHAILALRPERLAIDPKLDAFLHHEFHHLHDMVDPAFDYVAELPSASLTASQQRLVRDRYRLLWDVVIDGRLARRGLASIAGRDERHAEFIRALSFLSDPDALFARLWDDPSPTHDMLLGLALDPRGFREVHAPIPGAPCPLCGFATFQWAGTEELPKPAVERITRDFTSWRPAEGLCARCAEIYSATSSMAYPPTVLV